MNLFLCLLTLLVLATLAYRRSSHQVALVLLGLLAISAIIIDSVSNWLTLVLVIVFGITAMLGYDSIRQRFITQPLLQWFRRTLPKLSETEQAALDAGTVWWDAELFSGKPNWQRLLATPKPTLTVEEQAFLDGPADKLCTMLDDWQIQQDQDLPKAVWTFLAEQGFFGMIIDKRHGGLGFSALANSAVVMKIATRNVTAAVTVMVPNSLGPGELLQHYGTTAQKDRYLPKLASGAELPCFALTSPTAGSDAGSMSDAGVLCRGYWQGETVLGFRLNWQKRYITLAPVATLLGLAFKAYDPDGLLGGETDLGITCALVPTNLPGITIGRRHKPSGTSFMNGPTQGKDVFIALDQVIGGQAQIGKGWSMLVQSLAAGRAISLPAMGVGGSKMAVHATGAYARIRRQFKMPIGYFEGVEEVLGRMAGSTYRDDATRLLTLSALKLGEQPAVLTAIAKAYLTDSNRRTINDAMDVHGGKGIMLGPRNYLHNSYQAIPIGITVEGANILTRSMIVFGQGAIRAHPYILDEMQSAQEPDSPAALTKFDQAFFGHVAFTLSNFVRTFWMGLSGARLVSAPLTGPTAHYYRQLTRMSSAFAFISDLVLMTLGGNFKFREKLSGRLADVLAHMYMASAALKHFEDAGQPAEDLPLVNWAMRDSLYTIQKQLINVVRNFPIWWLRRPLKIIIFPLGLFYREPSDNLGKRAARILLAPGAARDRLTEGMYATDDGPGLAELNVAFSAVNEAAHASRRLRALTHEEITPENYETLIEIAQGLGELSDTEAALVRRAQQAIANVIAVDDFAPNHISTSKEPERFSTPAPSSSTINASHDEPINTPATRATNQVADSQAGGGDVDNLQRIKGIGPKLDETLRNLGYKSFAAIAALTAQDIASIEEHIKFSGRIERENWLEQARILAQAKTR